MDEFFSPDQQYKLSISSYDIRMSHWIDQPSLIRVSDNVTLFDLEHLWSASDIKWLNPSTVTMYLRLYPGLLACEVTLNPASNQGQVTGQAGTFEGTLTDVQEWINGFENPSEQYRY
ncbi:hypothetical protein GO730_36225 [Spirosoma sp. HMF3257]|uniref:Uncharacterized protein n=1 Tax=Spirosoma telluris TaxID=2183553 RepID=A0A327NWD6_9BACT|nr:hypothetical protein [Spirosoma telluris]RAI78174.1 hypothetical protein HMF3257_36140 [Spirosoma telluris]